MKRTLMIQALTKFAAGLLAVGLLLFLPAGTFHYPGGWRLCGLLFIPMLILGVALYRKAPELLKKRLQSKESQGEQKQVIGASLLLFVGGFTVAGLDHRFGWTALPRWAVWVSSIVFLISYGLYAEVMRENAYLSRTVEVQQGQKVIDTGLYGIVRHPMYFATTALFLSMPLVLGSLAAFVVFLPFPFLLVKRIRNEEAVLEAGLPGYKAYQQKVKYRMLPFIW